MGSLRSLRSIDLKPIRVKRLCRYLEERLKGTYPHFNVTVHNHETFIWIVWDKSPLDRINSTVRIHIETFVAEFSQNEPAEHRFHFSITDKTDKPVVAYMLPGNISLQVDLLR